MEKNFITKSNGRDLIKIDPLIWAKKLEEFGSGEIILTAINNEGTKSGFDIKSICEISNNIKIPVIAHGGAGSFEHVYQVIKKTNIKGVAIASLFHYNNLIKTNYKKIKIGNTTFLKNFNNFTNEVSIIKRLKTYLKNKDINVNI